MDARNQKKPPRANSLTGRVYAYVIEHGQCSLDELVAALGPTISAAHAIARTRSAAGYEKEKRGYYGMTTVPNELAARGRRIILTVAIARLVRHGHLRRVATGVYAPPLPKLHQSGQAS